MADFDLLLDPQVFQFLTHHEVRCDLRPGNPRGLADEGNSPGGSGIHLEDIDDVVLDGVLDIHQPYDMEFPGQSIGIAL